MYLIANTVEESLATKHSVGTALGRANLEDMNLDPRIHWIRDTYYTPSTKRKPSLPTYLFGCAPPPSIMDKLMSLSYESKQNQNPLYKDCTFDENGWTFCVDHWFSMITQERSNSFPYEASEDEEPVEMFDA